MDFGANRMLVVVIREGAFGGTYFRDIYSGVTRKWYKILWKEFEQLKQYWSEVLMFRLLWCQCQ